MQTKTYAYNHTKITKLNRMQYLQKHCRDVEWIPVLVSIVWSPRVIISYNTTKIDTRLLLTLIHSTPSRCHLRFAAAIISLSCCITQGDYRKNTNCPLVSCLCLISVLAAVVIYFTQPSSIESQWILQFNSIHSLKFHILH